MGGYGGDKRVPDELLVALRCARCGGHVVEQATRRARNPFLHKTPPRAVCVDCGLDFEVDLTDAPPSSKWPWA